MVGLFYSAIELVGVVSSLGIATSGGREVAQSHAKGDASSLARTIKVLRRCCWFTGFLGWLLSASLALPLSHWIFDSGEHAWAIAIVGFSLLLKAISEGQGTIIGGTRRMADLARISILSTILSTIAALAVYGWLREDGIVPVIILTAAINLFSSWFYARRITVEKVDLGWVETAHHARRFVGLGIAVVWGTVVASVVGLILRSQISTRLGLDAVGIFYAASNLSILFAGFVLGAMAADYFPRISAAAEDKPQLNRLINEQMEIGLLLVLPGIIGTLAYAPWIMTVFYSAKFIAGAQLLPWLVVGVFGRIISWPMGYVLMALGESRWHAATESFFGIFHLIIALALLHAMGLQGVALSYPILYIAHVIGMFCLLHHLTGFVWHSSLIRILTISIILVAVGFLANAFLPRPVDIIVGSIFTLTSAVYCLRGLVSRLGTDHRLVTMICRLPLGRLACGL